MSVIILQQLKMPKSDEFITWLDQQLERKEWTDYRLGIKTGLSSSVFSKARQGILPKWDALVRIADALDVSPITAFRKAGLLPPEGENITKFDDWLFLLRQLPKEDQDEIGQSYVLKYRFYILTTAPMWGNIASGA